MFTLKKIISWLICLFIFSAAILPVKAAAIELIPKDILECVSDSSLQGMPASCRDVSIFITLLINIGNYIFGIIGALALIVFVYGGFMFILSGGNQEKVKKGTDAMMAAVIGLAIAFGGYFIISFLGEAIKVKPEFKLK